MAGQRNPVMRASRPLMLAETVAGSSSRSLPLYSHRDPGHRHPGNDAVAAVHRVPLGSLTGSSGAVTHSAHLHLRAVACHAPDLGSYRAAGHCPAWDRDAAQPGHRAIFALRLGSERMQRIASMDATEILCMHGHDNDRVRRRRRRP
jgi:hypothetical protein